MMSILFFIAIWRCEVFPFMWEHVKSEEAKILESGKVQVEMSNSTLSVLVISISSRYSS